MSTKRDRSDVENATRGLDRPLPDGVQRRGAARLFQPSLAGRGYESYDGQYLQLDDARVVDLPETAPLMAVAASDPKSAAIAAELGDGLFATEAKPALLRAYPGR